MSEPGRAVGAGYHIGVFGHYGHQNMGDEAITQAVIQNLRRRCPSLRLSGFSMNPEDTARRYGIPAYPIRRLKPRTPGRGKDEETPNVRQSRYAAIRTYLKRVASLKFLVGAVRFAVKAPGELWREAFFLRDSYRVARDVDCFIIAGSNQFLDNYGGVWGFPYTLLKWTVIARCAGARVAFLSVGAGPIDSLCSRIMARASLLLAHYASFRDAGSRRLLEWAGGGRDWRVCPDLAQSLQIKVQPLRDGGHAPTVGINPMPVYDRRTWFRADDALYERYVAQLALFASRLLRERFPVFFFTTHPSDNQVIDDVLASIDSKLLAANGGPARKSSLTVDEVMSVFASADVVVATRYHGTVLGLRAGRPVLGVCYYRKTREVLRAMQQESYAVDFDEIDHEDLWRRFELLLSRRSKEADTIRLMSEAANARLDEQYDTVLKILNAPIGT
jgi:polysaccharide pyruvyl transferase WcaK-like protein